MQQGCLFPFSLLPDGFIYEAEWVTGSEECELLSCIRELNFKPFLFHGYEAKRRIVVYGWDYDFDSREGSTGNQLPAFLLRLRERCARLIGVASLDLAEAVVTEYPPGAPIGWHRDLPQFGCIVGISLLGSCTMRLRPYKGGGNTFNLALEPRSLYVISGAARWQYQHSIPPVKELRYSITFRTIRKGWRRDGRQAA